MKIPPLPSRRLEPCKQAVRYWEKAADPLAVNLWRQKIFLRCFLWRATFGFAESLKRLMDITISTFGLILSFPVFITISCCIYFSDRGPVFFKQLRVGEGGKVFYMLKFRSMKVGSEKMQTHYQHLNHHASKVTFKAKDDPRITPIGRFIRRTSLDELPQLLNVLRGDMALVGPRPPLVSEVQQYKAIELRRLRVKPGITCLWQIGGRAELDFKDQVRLDLQYIRSESFWENIKILLKTIPAVLFGKGAY